MSEQYKEIRYSTIGNIKYLKKRGVRRVSISVKPFKGVVVTMPFSFSYSDAEKFVLQKAEWITMAKEKMEKLEGKKTLFDENTEFTTRNHKLSIQRTEKESKSIAVKIDERCINVVVPSAVDIRLPAIQDVITKSIEKTWTIEAKEYLPVRLNELAIHFGFMYSGVVVKSIRSRWGSCSVTNNINLSIFLMQLPDYLIDYVILHELAHTVHKNHGVNFWALLDKITNGKAKPLAKEMKKYSTRYF